MPGPSSSIEILPAAYAHVNYNNYNATNQNGTFIFDELGLYTATGNLLTHIIFHPIQKSANRQIQVIYTVRVRAGAF